MAEWVPTPEVDPDPRPPPATQSPKAPGETYVVQVPKDQVFRVPPPENAHIAERYRNFHSGSRQSKNPCYSWLLWFLLVLLFVLLLIAVIAALLFSVMKPKLPTFSVNHVLVMNPHSPRPEYDIAMNTENPSTRTGYSYEKGGTASLSYGNKVIAKGKPPSFYQEYGDSETIKLVLAGSKVATLPKEIQKSMNGNTKSKSGSIPLGLAVEFPVKLKLGGIQIWATDMVVQCDVSVSTLAEGGRVMRRGCSVKFQ